MNQPSIAVLSHNVETKPGSPALAVAAVFHPIDGPWAAVLGVVAVACFHAAYAPTQSGWLAFGIVGYVVCLVQLARLRTTRQCFYTTLVIGFACVAPQLECFWRIFGPAAIALWLVLALWSALFVTLAHLALVRLGPGRAAALVPCFWTGLEYFRSELYYLKFSWLNVGYAFAETSLVPWEFLGVYGVGFVVAAWAGLFVVLPARRVLLLTGVTLGALMTVSALMLPTAKVKRPRPNFRMAGVQLEFPDTRDLVPTLDRVVAEDQRLVANHLGNKPLPKASLIVLPEYTLDGEPSGALKQWCRTHRKFLVVGGKQPLGATNYYNTAFVISTNGEIVFQQAKSVPIQFFQDGRPAPEQTVWPSPWGRIGLGVCYDLSYTRVTDELVRQGAQMLIVPTMDVSEWGRHQHELHARITPVRAAEYGIPIFRVASSGISQGVDQSGQVQSAAPFPGEGDIIFFATRLGEPGRVPSDRYLAQLGVFVAGAFVLWLAAGKLRALPIRPNPVAADVRRRKPANPRTVPPRYLGGYEF